MYVPFAQGDPGVLSDGQLTKAGPFTEHAVPLGLFQPGAVCLGQFAEPPIRSTPSDSSSPDKSRAFIAASSSPRGSPVIGEPATRGVEEPVVVADDR